MRRLIAVSAAALVLASSGVARAQIDNSGVLDSALKHFRTAAQGWEQASLSAAMTLFWMLATISLVWTVGQLAVKRADLGELFAELIRYLLFIGFWAWMLQNGPAHARLIVDSMQQLGGTATDRALLTPSRLVDVGFHLLERSLTQSNILSPVDSTIAITLSLVVVVVLALVAVNMLVLLVAIWVVAYGGLIVLGFGGSRWTSDMAIAYYKTVASLGLQAFAMALLVGVGQTLMEGYADGLASSAVQGLEGDTSLHEQAVLLVVAIMLLALVTKVPPLIGGLVTGASIQHSMGNGAGAGAAFAAGSTGLALATTMGGAQLMGLAKSGASTAAGPVESSLKDAFARGAGVSFGSGDGGDSGDGASESGSGGGSVFAVPADAGPDGEAPGPGGGSTGEAGPDESAPGDGPRPAPEGGAGDEASAPAGSEAGSPQPQPQSGADSHEASAGERIEAEYRSGLADDASGPQAGGAQTGEATDVSGTAGGDVPVEGQRAASTAEVGQGQGAEESSSSTAEVSSPGAAPAPASPFVTVPAGGAPQAPATSTGSANAPQPTSPVAASAAPSAAAPSPAAATAQPPGATAPGSEAASNALDPLQDAQKLEGPGMAQVGFFPDAASAIPATPSQRPSPDGPEPARPATDTLEAAATDVDFEAEVAAFTEREP